MYGVFDNSVLVRGGFLSFRDASNWKFANGNNPNQNVREYHWQKNFGLIVKQ